MKQTKEEFISELSYHINSEAGGHKQKPKFKRTKILGKLSPLGMILFAVGVAAALLVGSLFTHFYVQTSGNLELNGEMVPLFYYDDETFSGRFYNTTVDLTSMTSGDWINVTHTIENADNYIWGMTFTGDAVDPATEWRNDPMHPFYGFNFSVTKTNGQPLDDPFYFYPGQVKTIMFQYKLHKEFVTADDPYPFNLNMSLGMITPYIEVVDDVYTFAAPSGGVMDYYPMLNDKNVTDGTMHIDSITAYTPIHTNVWVTLEGDAIHVVRSPMDSDWTSGQSISLDYTIHDQDNTLTSTGTITIEKT